MKKPHLRPKVYHRSFSIGVCPHCKGLISVSYEVGKRIYEWRCRECGAFERYKEQEKRE